jgi:hypothetical protein
VVGGAVVGAGVGDGVLAGAAGAAGTAVAAAVAVGVGEAVLVAEVPLPGVVWLADAPHPASSKPATIVKPIPAAVLRTGIPPPPTNQHDSM